MGDAIARAAPNTRSACSYDAAATGMSGDRRYVARPVRRSTTHGPAISNRSTAASRSDLAFPFAIEYTARRTTRDPSGRNR